MNSTIPIMRSELLKPPKPEPEGPMKPFVKGTTVELTEEFRGYEPGYRFQVTGSIDSTERGQEIYCANDDEEDGVAIPMNVLRAVRIEPPATASTHTKCKRGQALTS